jgi:hypothetical protein
MTVAFASFSGFQHSAGKPVLLVLQSIARLSSQNSFKNFARLVKYSQAKLLAIQGSAVPEIKNTAIKIQ